MSRIPVHHFAVAASLLLLIAAQGCRFDSAPSTTTPADTSDQEVSFELAGPGGAALLIPVHINDSGPFDFVLDTGATYTCVDGSLADSLDLPDQAGQVGFGAGIGTSGRVQLVSIDSLRIGNVRAYDLTACALDLASLQQANLDISGLVGLNFLKEFQILLDFEREVVRFGRPN